MILKKTTCLLPQILLLFANPVFGQSNDASSGIPDRITIITAEKFYGIVDASPKEYHLLYSFAFWCKPCLETMPEIMEIINNSPEVQFYPVVMEKLESQTLIRTLTFLSEKYEYHGVVYAAAPSYANNMKKRYNALIAELAPGHTDFGLSLMLLLDKSKNVLYATTWHQSSAEKSEGLKELILELTN